MRRVIGKRIPKSDKWNLLTEGGVIFETADSLSEALELYYTNTGYKDEFILSPKTGEILIEEQNEIEEKRVNIYGEEY